VSFGLSLPGGTANEFMDNRAAGCGARDSAAQLAGVSVRDALVAEVTDRFGSRAISAVDPVNKQDCGAVGAGGGTGGSADVRRVRRAAGLGRRTSAVNFLLLTMRVQVPEGGTTTVGALLQAISDSLANPAALEAAFSSLAVAWQNVTGEPVTIIMSELPALIGVPPPPPPQPSPTALGSSAPTLGLVVGLAVAGACLVASAVGAAACARARRRAARIDKLVGGIDAGARLGTLQRAHANTVMLAPSRAALPSPGGVDSAAVAPARRGTLTLRLPASGPAVARESEAGPASPVPFRLPHAHNTHLDRRSARQPKVAWGSVSVAQPASPPHGPPPVAHLPSRVQRTPARRGSLMLRRLTPDSGAGDGNNARPAAHPLHLPDRALRHQVMGHVDGGGRSSSSNSSSSDRPALTPPLPRGWPLFALPVSAGVNPSTSVRATHLLPGMRLPPIVATGSHGASPAGAGEAAGARIHLTRPVMRAGTGGFIVTEQPHELREGRGFAARQLPGTVHINAEGRLRHG
jgi:hypothetical protein